MSTSPQTASHNVVVIGVGYAGLLAALRLAYQTRGHQVQITLVNASKHFVERIRLHQLATGQRLTEHPLDRLIAGTGILFKQGTVVAIAPDEKTIRLETSASGSVQIAYDTLIYALGSKPDRLRIPGIADHAYTLDFPSVGQFFDKLNALEPDGQVLVIGGGLTGIEAATEIAQRFPKLHVTLTTSGTFGNDLSLAGQSYLRGVFGRLGIAVCDHITVNGLYADYAITSSGERLQFGACLTTVGFTVPDLARQAGIAVNPSGQVIVDSYLRSISHPDVYAVGDSAVLNDAGLSLRMACATAMPMGAHVADTISSVLDGRPPEPFAFGYALRCISLGRHRGLIQIVDSGDQPVERIITGWQGALVKELVCRYTFVSLQLARRWGKLYRWPRVRQYSLVATERNEVPV